MGDPVEERTRKVLSGIPPGVEVVGAVKSRTPGEVASAVRGGLKIIGHNYVQEAEKMLPDIKGGIEWHFIGRIQGNKIRKMVEIFDMVETLDSLKHCEIMEKACSRESRIMPVLVGINPAGEESKAGVIPGEVFKFIEEASLFPHIKIQGLMTMGPNLDAGQSRAYFRMMKSLFEEIDSSGMPGIRMEYLSMGMSRTYPEAIEEGANLVRLGTRIFGPLNREVRDTRRRA